jgi:hypothetical protein
MEGSQMASQWAMQIAAGLLPTTYAQRTTRRAQEKVADALDAARKAGIEEAAAYAAAHQYRKSFADSPTAPREGTQMPRQPPIDILPIQIREDVTVQIAGIPHDLTREEAQKIARVVLALAEPDHECWIPVRR